MKSLQVCCLLLSICFFSHTQSQELKTEQDNSTKEALAIGKRFAKATAEGDTEFLNKLIDFGVIFDKAMRGIKLPDEFIKGARLGFIGGRKRMVSDFITATYDIVTILETGPEPTIRYRVRRDGALDYVDYTFKKNKQGDWNLLDANVHSMGTKLTDLLRNMALPMIAEADKSLLERFLLKNKMSRPHLDSIPKLGMALRLARQGDPESAKKALKVYNSVPPEIQKTRFAQMLNIIACGSLPNAYEPGSEYQKALETFSKHFPNDASRHLHALDQTILAGKLDETHKTIDKLIEVTGDKDYLELYRGYVFLHQEEFDKVEQAGRTFITKYPNDIEGWEVVLEAGFGAGNHALTAESLTALESNFEVDYSGVTQLEEWKPFCTSKEGEKWLAQR